MVKTEQIHHAYILLIQKRKEFVLKRMDYPAQKEAG